MQSMNILLNWLEGELNIRTLLDQVNIVGFRKSGMDIKTGEASIVTKTNIICFKPQNLNKMYHNCYLLAILT